MSGQEPAKDAFKELYAGLDRERLAKQGAGFLDGRADARARRAVGRMRRVAWLVIALAFLLAGVFALWLLLVARDSGQSLGAVRDQAVRAYLQEDP